jgi:hypothetical protein
MHKEISQSIVLALVGYLGCGAADSTVPTSGQVSPPKTANVMGRIVPLPGYVATAQGKISVPAGQADGSPDPQCPPAKCAQVRVDHMAAPNDEIIFLNNVPTMFYSDLSPISWTACPMMVNVYGSPGTYNAWACKLYAKFDQLAWGPIKGTGEAFAQARFRNWASRGRWAMIQVQYWVKLDHCIPDWTDPTTRIRNHVIC